MFWVRDSANLSRIQTSGNRKGKWIMKSDFDVVEETIEVSKAKANEREKVRTMKGKKPASNEGAKGNDGVVDKNGATEVKSSFVCVNTNTGEGLREFLAYTFFSDFKGDMEEFSKFWRLFEDIISNGRDIKGETSQQDIHNLDLEKIIKILLNNDPLFDTDNNISKLTTMILRYKHAKILEKSYRERNWKEMWCLFPARTRIIPFLYIRKHLDDRTYYEVLGDLINNGCYMGDYLREIEYFLYAPDRDHSFIKYMMSADERKVFEKLSKGTIYRGCSRFNKDGYSWTTDIEKTRYFASLHKGKSMILKGTFDPKDAIAYFSREKEIFIHPSNVHDKSVVEKFHNKRYGGNPFSGTVHQKVYDFVQNDPVYNSFFKNELFISRDLGKVA